MPLLPLALLSVFLFSPASAQQSAPSAPQPPAAVAGKPVAEAPVELVPVTTELLKRWGLDPARYQALAPEQKLEVQRQLSLQELGRLRRLQILQRLVLEECAAEHRPQCALTDAACAVRHLNACDALWKRCVTPEGLLSDEGEKRLNDFIAKQKGKPLAVPAQVKVERKDGKALTAEDLARAQIVLNKMFDGVQNLQKGSGTPPDAIDWDARFQNGTLHHLTATNPRTGVSLEVGQLGVDGRHALLAPSWYGNLTKRAESDPDHWVDYRFQAQIGYVDLRARFFNDDRQDPRVGRAIDLMRNLGLPENNANKFREYTTYDDAYRTQGMIVTSLMFEMGRAYNLFGPVDVSWTVGNLTKIVFLAPNTAFDETLGIRVKLKDNLFMGVFGGVVHNFSMVGSRPVQEALSPDKVAAGLYIENAPHATLALWGEVPGISDLKFSASAGARFNKDTTVHQGELALTTTLFNRPLSLRGIASSEKGPQIEFDRQKLRAQLEYQLSDSALAYLAYEKDRIRYGNAEVNSDAFMAGFEIVLGGSGGRNTVSVEQLFGGEYKNGHPLSPELPQILTSINRTMSQGLETASQARDLYEKLRQGPLSRAEMELALNQLSLSLQRLDPDTASRLLEQLAQARLSDAQRRQLSDLFLRTVSQGSEHYNRLRDILSTALAPGGALDEGVADLESRVADAMQRYLGRSPSPEELRRINEYLEAARRFAQGQTLTQAQIDQFREQGLNLINSLAAQRLSPQQLTQLQNLLTTHAESLNSLIQGGDLAARADKWLRKIDDAVAFFNKHEPDIRELLGLLGNPQVWDAAVVQAGRAAMLKAVARGKNITIPLINKDVHLELSAPVALAAANMMQSRLSPVNPIKRGEVEPWLLREAAASLGMKADNVTEEMVAQAIFDKAGAEISRALTARLSERMDPLLANLGNYNLQDAANKVLAALPPSLSQRLQERYGADLAGLLPATGTAPDQIKQFLLERLPKEVMDFLYREYGGVIANQVGELVAWAAELMRREMNMSMIHLLLASEELNRMTVDKGLKISDWNVKMAMSSFDKLDARARSDVQYRFRAAARRISEDAAIDEVKLAARFMDHGKARLDALQMDPRWPRGLKVEIAEKDWLPLLTLYGDGGLFALIDEIKAKYQETPAGMTVSFEFDSISSLGGTAIRPSGTKDLPAVRYCLGKPKDEREAKFRLSGLAGYVAEHQQERAAKERFDAPQRRDDWPAGFSVDASMGTVSQLIRYYGENATFAMLERLAAGYPAGAKPFKIALEFDYNGAEKPAVKVDPKTGATVFVVGKPKDARDGRARYSAMMDAVYKRAKTR